MGARFNGGLGVGWRIPHRGCHRSCNVFDVLVTLVFGVLGYVLTRLRYNAAPVLLGFILGPMMEENLRRSLVISRGDITVFFDRPMSVALLALSALLIVMPLWKPAAGWLRHRR